MYSPMEGHLFSVIREFYFCSSSLVYARAFEKWSASDIRKASAQNFPDLLRVQTRQAGFRDRRMSPNEKAGVSKNILLDE